MSAGRRQPVAGRKKNTRPAALCVGDALKAFLARQVPTIGRCKAVARTDSSGWRPVVRFDHNPCRYDGKLLRATSYKSRATALSSDSDAAFRHDRLMIVLRPSATRHKFWLCTGFATGRPTEHPPGRPLRYRIQAMGEKEVTDCKKNTRPTALCVGDAQRASRLGDSTIAYSSIMAGFYEPRTTAIATSRWLLEAMYSI